MRVARALPRPLWAPLLVTCLLLLWPLAAPARGFDGRAGEDIVIEAGQTIDDDLYVAGRSLTIDGTVRGDVLAVAQTVTINGSIDGSLMTVAQAVIVNGFVRDTTRVAALAFVMSGGGRVGRDVILSGYSGEIQPGSTVGRDLIAWTGQTLLDGRVQRHVRGGMDALQINGQVGGDVNVSIGGTPQAASKAVFGGAQPEHVAIPAVPRGLTVTDAARIDGRLRYESTRDFALSGSVGQGITWIRRAANEAAPRGPADVAADIARKAIAIALTGLLLLWLAPGGLRLVGDTIQARPIPSLGWGLLVAAIVIVAIIGIAFGMITFALGFAVIGLVSLSGLVLMLGVLSEVLLIVGLVVFTGLAAQAIVSHRAARTLLRRVGSTVAERDALPIFLGALLFAAVTEIPVLGGLIGLATGLATLGAGWIVTRDRPGPRGTAPPGDASSVPGPAPAE